MQCSPTDANLAARALLTAIVDLSGVGKLF